VGWFASVVTGGDAATWVLAFVSIMSFTFLGATLYFILRILRMRSLSSPVLALMVLMNIPLLHFAVQWTKMSHPAEAMLAFGTVLALMRDRLSLALLSAAALMLTRFNDAPIVLLILGYILDRDPRRKLPPKLLYPAFALTGLSLLSAVWILFVKGYGGLTLPQLIRDFSWKSAGHFIWGADWGMLWTGTWWLLSLLLGAIGWKRLSWLGRGALLWLVAELVVCILWRGNGSDYGYRYLSGSYAAALVVWLEALAWDTWVPRAFRWSVVYGGLLHLYLNVVYKTIHGLGPILGPNLTRAEDGFGNPTFLLKVAENVFNPEVYKTAALQQLPAVTLYLSWFKPGGSELARYQIDGPELWVLTGATLFALSSVAAYLWARRDISRSSR
jgi:hypothetical protein